MENSANVSTNEIENFLVRRLGDQEGRQIMDYINAEIDKNVAARVAGTRVEIEQWRTSLKDDFATKEDAAVLQERLVKRVSSVEGTLILWAFVFWFTLIVAMYVIFKYIP